jgi:hypothetical protein
MERLLSMLPYKSLSLSTLEGRHGVYALIDKSERKKEMKQSLPSVRAQLQTEKSPKVPKKTAKSKHSNIQDFMYCAMAGLPNRRCWYTATIYLPS